MTIRCTDLRAERLTRYGRAAVSWTAAADGCGLVVDVEVPPNTSATIDLPGVDDPVRVGSGRHRFDDGQRRVAI